MWIKKATKTQNIVQIWTTSYLNRLASVKGSGVVPAKSPAVESDGDDQEEGLSSEEEEVTVKAGNATVTPEGDDYDDDDDSEDDESDDDEEKPAAETVATEKKTEASEIDSSGNESKEEDEEVCLTTEKKTEASEVDSSENESKEEGEESDEEMPDAKSPKTVAKQAVKAFEKNAPKTPAAQVTPQASGSKTLFMGNLPFKIEQEDIITFFKEPGAEVYEVRIGMEEDGLWPC